MDMFSRMVVWVILLLFASVVAQVFNATRGTTSDTCVVPTELTHILVATDADTPILVATEADITHETSACPAKFVAVVIGLVQNK